MTDEALARRLDRIEEKQDALLKSFTDFRVKEFTELRERTSRLEVKAGLFGLMGGLVAAIIKGRME